MKNTIILIILVGLGFSATAQQDTVKKKGTQKVVEKAEQISQKTKEISNASNQVADQVRQTADNVKNVVENVKAVIKVFEPILNLHIFKKKENSASNNGSVGSTMDNTTNNNSPQNAPLQQQVSDNRQPSNGSPNFVDGSNNNQNTTSTTDNSGSPVYGTPENDQYNADGTMNMGHQNNGKYGNCLNLLEGKVVGMGEAEEHPERIDLIFFSQYGGIGYSFESPYDAPTINEGVGVKKWRERNETEFTETKLTIGQFEKIKTNPELLNVVKNAQGFGASFYTGNKMEGRVFAVKVMQDDRELYALLAVYNQFGTGGSKGYLKIKIKVQGIDTNGDGNPDAKAYQRQ